MRGRYFLGVCVSVWFSLYALGCGSGASSNVDDTSSGPVLTGAGGGAGAGSGSGQGGMGGVGAGGNGGMGGSAGEGGGALVDADKDGLDDIWENKLAVAYLPFLSLDPDDKCPRGGIVYRVRPHPNNAAMIHILYDHLFERDCGLTSHVGDNEAFGVTIDPTIPPPQGILTLVAIGHQSTLCEKKTMCGSCAGLDACGTAMKNGSNYPVVYSSKDKHATYVEKNKCNPILSCLDTCSLAPTSANVPMVNVGEPGAPLVSNLTEQGFINSANGWVEQELWNWDPWDNTKDFGGAGNVAGDLVDEAFVPPACP